MMSTHSIARRGVAIALAVGLIAGAAHADKFNMDVTLDGLTLGEHVMGDAVNVADLKNKVVLVEMWGVNCPPCVASLPKMAKLYDEKKDQGLVIIGIHRQRATIDEIRNLCTSKGVTFPIYASGSIRGGDDFSGIPHCFLFDHTGKVVERGHPSSMYSLVDKLLAAAPAAALGGRELVALKPLGDALKAGQSPVSVMKKAERELDSDDTATAEEARYIVDQLQAFGEKQLESAKAKQTSDPLGCMEELDALSKDWRGHEIGNQARDALRELRGDKAFKDSMRLAQFLEGVKKLEGELQIYNNDSSSDRFKQLNQRTLGQMYAAIARMKKMDEASPFTAEAIEIGKRYGLEVE